MKKRIVAEIGDDIFKEKIPRYQEVYYYLRKNGAKTFKQLTMDMDMPGASLNSYLVKLKSKNLVEKTICTCGNTLYDVVRND